MPSADAPNFPHICPTCSATCHNIDSVVPVLKIRINTVIQVFLCCTCASNLKRDYLTSMLVLNDRGFDTPRTIRNSRLYHFPRCMSRIPPGTRRYLHCDNRTDTWTIIPLEQLPPDHDPDVHVLMDDEWSPPSTGPLPHNPNANGEIMNYHSGTRNWEGRDDRPSDKPLIGVELEILANSVSSRSVIAGVAHKYGLLAETDGSLDRSRGVEIVGPPIIASDYTRNPNNCWVQFLKIVNKDKLAVGWDAGKGYGMHVSLNRLAMPKGKAQAALQALISNHHDFIAQIAGRTASNYCAYYYKGEPQTTPLNHNGKYEACALRSDTRMEIRIFRSTINLVTFLKNVEWCESLRVFCNETYSASPLDHLRWLANHKEDYPNLLLWMNEQGRYKRLLEIAEASTRRAGDARPFVPPATQPPAPSPSPTNAPAENSSTQSPSTSPSSNASPDVIVRSTYGSPTPQTLSPLVVNNVTLAGPLPDRLPNPPYTVPLVSTPTPFTPLPPATHHNLTYNELLRTLEAYPPGQVLYIYPSASPTLVMQFFKQSNGEPYDPLAILPGWSRLPLSLHILPSYPSLDTSRLSYAMRFFDNRRTHATTLAHRDLQIAALYNFWANPSHHRIFNVPVRNTINDPIHNPNNQMNLIEGQWTFAGDFRRGSTFYEINCEGSRSNARSYSSPSLDNIEFFVDVQAHLNEESRRLVRTTPIPATSSPQVGARVIVASEAIVPEFEDRYV